MQAMILAAGLGTRLLPHTLVKPKPLFPILNQPLLLLIINRLKSLGFDHIIVNCYHLSEQIVEMLKGDPVVLLQEEEVILGTGGGLRRALNQFRDEPILVVNGDIYHTVNLKNLYRYHMDCTNKITMATHDYPRFNSVSVRGTQITSFDRTGNLEKVAFTGIHVVDPDVLESIQADEYSCIIDHYRSLLQMDTIIDRYNVDGCFWSDIGTPADYLLLHEGLLKGTIPRWKELGESTGSFCIAPGALLSDSVRMGGWVSIDNGSGGKEAYIENSVVWADITITSGSRIVNQIMSSNNDD